MPSEAHAADGKQDRMDAVMEGVREPMEAFRSALVRAIEDIRGYLATHRAADGDRSSEVASQLGAFGTGRIDAARFAGLLAAPQSLDAERLHRVETAVAHLEAQEAKGDALFRAGVLPGGDLRDTVARALARIGSVFGMVRVVASARDGRSEPLDPAAFAEGFPAHRWGTSERRMAPPLVVEVEGADLVVGGLDPFLDGGLDLVLVVRGPAPPAPLAALIRPGVFVAQITDPADLSPALAFTGPSAVAVMPAGAARFVHDPRAGAGYASRLTLHDAPPPDQLEAAPGFRQRQDLEHLLALAAAAEPATAQPAEGGAAATPAASDAPADRLAGWLMQQAGLS